MKRRLNWEQRQPQYVFKVPGSSRIWRWGVLGSILLIMGLLLLSGEKSLFKVIALYQEKNRLLVQSEELEKNNQKLSRQIKDLKTDPQAIEHIAREELGMVQKDETVYRFVPASMSGEANE